MNLKCRINSVDYNLVQGVTFSEEYNETLDSGSTIITHVGRIENLNPYDDIYIWNSDEEFDGFSQSRSIEKNINASVTKMSDGKFRLLFDKNLPALSNKISIPIIFMVTEANIFTNNYKLQQGITTDILYLVDENATTLSELQLIAYYNEKREVLGYYVDIENVYTNIYITTNIHVILSSDKVLPKFYRHLLIDQYTEEIVNISKRIYKYKIELFSETKGLETIQLPNISITQPLNIKKKKSVYQYAKDFVNLYSPLIKVKFVDGSWAFTQKYVLDDSIEEIFGSVYSPDFSLNSPNLRDVLNKLFIVKDRIPYVKDNVIYALDITERKNTFNLNEGTITNIVGSKSSDNYCNNLKRKYENALSQDKSCRMIEYLGFRNSSESLLTIDNMRLETRFPIYKINKIYMCYYKRGSIYEMDSTTDTGKKVMFLCKQDITKLVKLNNERDLLSKDWIDFETSGKPKNIDELATFKICTVGYDIGSNLITGWGNKYEYVEGIENGITWWKREATYIENILRNVDSYTPFGIYNYGYVTSNIDDNKQMIFDQSDIFKNIITEFSNDSLSLKGLIFLIDYDAFYSGTIIHTKDNPTSDITINDNSSSSLTLLEQDGLFQKEKINRFGNKGITINARYNDISEMQELGSVYEYDGETDVIIYHREYSIFNNVINCTYYGTKDYVLKNYFTSVFAKHRTYNLMSYNESVLRAENKKAFILLSKNEAYYENQNYQFLLSDFTKEPAFTILSCFNKTPTPSSKNAFIDINKINYGYISFNNNDYACDINAFVSGYSLCFNLQMFDNVSGGVYIETPEPSVDTSVEDDYKGSIQKWYLTVDDSETGFAENMGFYICHIDQQEEFGDQVQNYSAEKISEIYSKLFALPKIQIEKKSNTIGNVYKLNKDNKEQLNLTFQFEPITNDDNVMFSQWMMKLSDLLSNYRKFDEDVEVYDVDKYNFSINVLTCSIKGTAESTLLGLSWFIPVMVIELSENDFSKLSTRSGLNGRFAFTQNELSVGDSAWWFTNSIIAYTFDAKEISYIDDEKIKIKGEQVVIVDEAALGPMRTYYSNVEIVFKRQNYIGGNPVSSGTRYYSTAYIGSYIRNCDLYDENKIRYENVTAGTNDYQFSNGTIIERTGDFISISDFKTETCKVTDLGSSNITMYLKNMFVVLSNETMKKTLVYDEYSFSNFNIDASLKVTDYFKLKTDENGIRYIEVDLSNVSSDVKSIQYWYLEREDDTVYNSGTYRFVFGVNITDEDIEKGYVKVNISMLSSISKTVYDINYNIVGKITNYASPDNKKKYGEDQYYDV